VRSSGALLNLTIKLSIGRTPSLSSGRPTFSSSAGEWEARVSANVHGAVMRKFA
jgi:hypothetical protein